MDWPGLRRRWSASRDIPATGAVEIAPVGGTDYNMSIARRAAVAICVLSTAAACATGLARSQALRPVDQAASPLTLISVPTPPFRVTRYDTSGSIPQVRGGDVDLRRVNAALRGAVLADQRAFAPEARRGAIGAAKWYRGVYRTSVDRGLLSASDLVVSALMPAMEQYPGGSLGKGWLAVTVRVPSAEPVTITSLFANPPTGLRVLATAWTTLFRRTSPQAWPCIQLHRSDYRPTATNYRYFALTPRGLAIGFWQEEACNRLYATVPYSTLRPYLSKLGSTLVAGVRLAH